MAQLMERTQPERPRVVVVRRGMPPRRSTPHRDRALQELDLLLNATDREAFLEQTQKLTTSCVAAAQERLKPPEPKPSTLPPPPPSVVEAVSPLPLASIPRKPLPSSDALKGLSPGSALKKLRELRTEQNAPVAEEREVQEGSEEIPEDDDASDDDDASAFAGGARSPAFGGAPPPKTRSPARTRSPRSPAPRLSERQAAALRAALSRCVQSTANAVADEIADDPEVCEAFGARPLGLAVGFLRTLAENPVDHRAVGEIVARSAAAAGGRSPRTA